MTLLRENPYRTALARVENVRDETRDVRTLQLAFEDAAAAEAFQWRAGQFALFSVFGTGECVFTLANSPTRRHGPDGTDTIECTFRAVGKVTHALRGVGAGMPIGIRGPFGNAFDVEAWKGKDIAIIGGGIGMAAVRSPLQYVLDHRDDYGEVLVLNGARSVADVVYQAEAEAWREAGATVVATVDPGGESPEWRGEVGRIPEVFERLGHQPGNRIVVACGPPIMLTYLFQALGRMNYAPEDVVTTLENKMKCGIGHCGRCNVGRTYVCTDGPVFTWARLQTMLDDL